MKMQITTEKCFVIIYTLTTVSIGVEATQIDYDNGRSYFTWKGHDCMYKM